MSTQACTCGLFQIGAIPISKGGTGFIVLWQKSSSDELSDGKIETAPKEVHGAGLADEIRSETPHEQVGRDDRRLDFSATFRSWKELLRTTGGLPDARLRQQSL